MKMYRIYEGDARLATVHRKSAISPALQRYTEEGRHITSVICFSPSSGKTNEILREFDCVINAEKYKYQRSCANCHAVFGANKSDKKCCSKSCSSDLWHGKNVAGAFSENKLAPAPAKPSAKKTKVTLADINAAARKLGMTYGQYMGMQYAQGMR